MSLEETPKPVERSNPLTPLVWGVLCAFGLAICGGVFGFYKITQTIRSSIPTLPIPDLSLSVP